MTPTQREMIQRDTDRDRAERKASEPLRGAVPQRFDLDGLTLWDECARPQPQLFDKLD